MHTHTRVHTHTHIYAYSMRVCIYNKLIRVICEDTPAQFLYTCMHTHTHVCLCVCIYIYIVSMYVYTTNLPVVTCGQILARFRLIAL